MTTRSFFHSMVFTATPIFLFRHRPSIYIRCEKKASRVSGGFLSSARLPFGTPFHKIRNGTRHVDPHSRSSAYPGCDSLPGHSEPQRAAKASLDDRRLSLWDLGFRYIVFASGKKSLQKLTSVRKQLAQIFRFVIGF